MERISAVRLYLGIVGVGMQDEETNPAVAGESINNPINALSGLTFNLTCHNISDLAKYENRISARGPAAADATFGPHGSHTLVGFFILETDFIDQFSVELELLR